MNNYLEQIYEKDIIKPFDESIKRQVNEMALGPEAMNTEKRKQTLKTIIYSVISIMEKIIDDTIQEAGDLDLTAEGSSSVEVIIGMEQFDDVSETILRKYYEKIEDVLTQKYINVGWGNIEFEWIGTQMSDEVIITLYR